MNGPRGTCGDAEFTFKTRVVIDRTGIARHLRGNENGAEKNEISELWMNHIAMNSHPTKTGSHGNRLMRYGPWLSSKAICFHWKARCTRNRRPDLERLEFRNYLLSNNIRFVRLDVKLQVRDRTSWSPDILLIHSTDEADQCLCP